MRNLLKKTTVFMILCLLIGCGANQEKEKPFMRFDFNDDVKSDTYQLNGQDYVFDKGIDKKALVLNPDKGYNSLKIESDSLSLDGSNDFSIQCWIKTTSKNPTVFLSQKNFDNKSIHTQRNAGWALYSTDGTFGWSIGSGSRRVSYDRSNGGKMPINDGAWHQITITYNKEFSEFRLYYDGHNKVVYKINFEFLNDNPLVVGSIGNQFDYENKYTPEIENGLEKLQAFVDAFNELGLGNLKNEEFIDLIISPNNMIRKKMKDDNIRNRPNKEAVSKVLDVQKKLGSSAYTVSQNDELTNIKPVSKIYALQDGKVVINASAGKFFTKNEKLFPSDFSMDRLSIWKKTISEEQVLNSYNVYKETKPFELKENISDFTVGVWNIWHGGLHWTSEKDGWDSRKRVVEIAQEKNLDVILMQETYSSGDFIAAELGYYYATTSDWDYCFQGENISVISRYPIKEIQVSEDTEFNNVAVKLAISDTQEIWAMSNWYGMNNFQKVFDFNKSRFDNSDNIPVVFGGDFNAVPHTDGGKSPASKKMLESGFTDAYRSLYPDVEKYPGFSHQGDVRIDQLYYKGKGLENTSTEVISSWPTGFPSDHFLIVSKFKLNY